MKNKIFESNPHLKEVYSTSDGEVFYNDNDARMHAKTLKEKKVDKVINPKFLDVIAENVSSVEDTNLKADADAKVKADADAKVKADAQNKNNTTDNTKK